jgi:pantothenate kinase-related protein Tda10
MYSTFSGGKDMETVHDWKTQAEKHGLKVVLEKGGRNETRSSP